MSSGTQVELVKKATCVSLEIQEDKQYLVMGSRGSEVTLERSFRWLLLPTPLFLFLLPSPPRLTCCVVSRYRLPLDSEALVELWPTDCSSPECLDYISQLDDFALDLQLMSCPEAS